MFRIAICDDDIALCRDMEKALYNKFTDIYVECFGDGYFFLEAIKDESFDVVILDIVFEGKIAGINIGNAIRNKYKNDYTQIIYISNYDGYAMSLFETRPLNFLVKPIVKERLYDVVEKALNLCNYGGNILTFNTSKKTLRILYKDILYITKDRRKLMIFKKIQYSEFKRTAKRNTN